MAQPPRLTWADIQAAVDAAPTVQSCPTSVLIIGPAAATAFIEQFGELPHGVLSSRPIPRRRADFRT